MPDLRDHTTLRLGGPGREWVRATTEAELVAAVADADAAGTPVLLLAGGSNLVVADEGFDGLVVEVATTGVDADTDTCDVDALAQCGGVVLTVAAGEDWDELVAHAVGQGWAGIEALSGIPGRRRLDPHPERRRLRAGRLPDHRPRPHLGPRRPHPAHLRRRRLRLRLPPQPLQGRARALRRARGDLPAAAGRPVRAGGLRRARPHPRCQDRGARPTEGRARRGAGAALRQGDGARRRRPRHLERRVVLHQPVPDARAGRGPARRRPAVGAARRHREVERRVAHRARRLRQGLRQPGRGGAGAPVHQAHPRPDQPRRRHHRGAARPSPARCATGCASASASRSSTSP